MGKGWLRGERSHRAMGAARVCLGGLPGVACGSGGGGRDVSVWVHPLG